MSDLEDLDTDLDFVKKERKNNKKEPSYRSQNRFSK